MNIQKSTFAGQAPAALFVKIDHREPALVQTILATAPSGDERIFTFTFDTCGHETGLTLAGGDGLSRARWDGPELVIESVFTTAQRTFRFEDHWSMSADGATMRMVHRNDDLAGQDVILERVPRGQPHPFVTQPE